MTIREDIEDYDEVCKQIDNLFDRQDSPQFAIALSQLKAFAEAGSLDAAEFLAEILAYDGPHHDAASAYKWYFVTLSAQGYSTDFKDKNGTPPLYCGPTGDFRNESMVNDLVTELGFERVAKIDSEIRQWLAR
jgi:hypothetical protein